MTMRALMRKEMRMKRNKSKVTLIWQLGKGKMVFIKINECLSSRVDTTSFEGH